MALGVDDVLGIASGVLGVANTGYNIYTNKRDFDYQKALQQQIFEREDTAVQRRMNDLKAAGLNPNLAAGSAANAGSVVARSSTNDVNMGSVLDFLQAINQIRAQKSEKQLLDFNIQKAQQDYTFERAMDLYLLGFNPKIAYGYDGKIHLKAENEAKSFSETNVAKQLDYQMANLKNSSSMLEKENNWYTANQIINAVSGLIGDISLFTPKFIKRFK